MAEQLSWDHDFDQGVLRPHIYLVAGQPAECDTRPAACQSGAAHVVAEGGCDAGLTFAAYLHSLEPGCSCFCCGKPLVAPIDDTKGGLLRCDECGAEIEGPIRL